MGQPLRSELALLLFERRGANRHHTTTIHHLYTVKLYKIEVSSVKG